jgi:hypothetical protein
MQAIGTNLTAPLVPVQLAGYVLVLHEVAMSVAAELCAYTYALLINRRLGKLQGRIKGLWDESDYTHLASRTTPAVF